MPDIDPKWTNAIEQLHDVIGIDGVDEYADLD